MVLTRLKECNLKLNPKKCKVMQRKIKYVGYIVSEHGAEADPEKIEKVINWREPKKTEDKKRIPVLESKIDNAQDSMEDELEDDDEIVVTQTTNRAKENTEIGASGVFTQIIVPGGSDASSHSSIFDSLIDAADALCPDHH